VHIFGCSIAVYNFRILYKCRFCRSPATSSYGLNVVYINCKKLKSTKLAWPPVAQHCYQISWKSLDLFTRRKEDTQHGTLISSPFPQERKNDGRKATQLWRSYKFKLSWNSSYSGHKNVSTGSLNVKFSV